MSDVINVTHESDAIEFVPDSVEELLDEFQDEKKAILWLNREVSKREKIKNSLDSEIEDLQSLKEKLREKDFSVKNEV